MQRRTLNPAALGVLDQISLLLQSSQLTAPLPGNEHLNDYLEYEFVFERRVDTRARKEGQ